MTDPPPSLKWLVTFRAVAHCGSVQDAAHQTGQSVSTVSHHLLQLEEHLGVALMDHSSRPMTLTSQGAVYQRYATTVLDLMAEARRDLAVSEPGSLRRLRFAMIEDFDSEIGPEITRLLATTLPNCRFTHFTRVSHEILQMLKDRAVDIGVATQPQTPLSSVHEIPILRDPFVLAVPARADDAAEAFLGGQAGLPFLRYSRSQIMGALIEAQLTRLQLSVPNAFELDSTMSILSLVAHGDGWTITTPGNYARAQRFQSDVRLLPFPRKEFARTISIFVADPQMADVAQTIAQAMRQLLVRRAIAPLVQAHPWLDGRYRLITG